MQSRLIHLIGGTQSEPSTHQTTTIGQSKATGPNSVCDRLHAREWAFNRAQFVDLLIEQQGN